MTDTRQQVVPFAAIARGIRGESFVARVDRFAETFGEVDTDTRAVMAQASLLCWFESEYEQNFLEVCRAIGQGKPTTQYHCRQLTPTRWVTINTYVVGVRRWLGCPRPLPGTVDESRIEQIGHWLGDRSESKDALCNLFLVKLIDELWNYAGLTRLGSQASTDSSAYVDFTEWYYQNDGTAYATDRSAVNDASHARLSEWYHGRDLTSQVSRRSGDTDADTALRLKIRDINARVISALGLAAAEMLLRGILTESQPPCHHRFTRYLDIQITSIGCLKWRGNLPLSDLEDKQRSVQWLTQASSAATSWVSGDAPQNSLAVTIHHALGDPSPRKNALVADFLLADREAMFDWLTWYSRDHDYTPIRFFETGGSRLRD
jgi:hypothetical protein